MSVLKQIRNNWVRVLATAVVVLGSLVPVAAAEAASQPRDCDSNSIVWCGAYTKSEWANKVHNGDGHNSASNIQHIYFSEGRGITESEFNSSDTVQGTVFKDGRVEVNGQVVATGAKSVGRTFMTGSVKSGTVWMRPTQTSFVADSIPSWVNMQGGKFHWFIIQSCGNAGVATPKPVPTPSPTPKPTPKPTPSPTPTPTPTPMSFSCEVLTPSQPDVNNPNQFRFTVTPKAQNVTITGFRFSFSDHSAQVDTAADTPFTDKTVATGSSLKVQGQVKTSAGITALSEACSATVSVSKSPTHTPTPTPTQPGQVLGVTLPATGPETALGGAAGLSAIGFAGRAYIRSKKSLLGTLRGKRDK